MDTLEESETPPGIEFVKNVIQQNGRTRTYVFSHQFVFPDEEIQTIYQVGFRIIKVPYFSWCTKFSVLLRLAW